MPISRNEFQRLGERPSGLDLSVETILGRVYRFLLTHTSYAFRQDELVDAIDGPQEAIESSLNRLEQRGFVDHRGRFWAIADCELAVISASLHGAVSAGDIDGGFSDEDVATWMETAIDPIEEVPNDEKLDDS
jgi:hypothetical protein